MISVGSLSVMMMMMMLIVMIVILCKNVTLCSCARTSSVMLTFANVGRQAGKHDAAEICPRSLRLLIMLTRL